MKIPDSYTSQSVERQLGALAASLARVASAARKPARAGGIPFLLEECIRYIEWTAPRLAPEVGGELVELQLRLGLWHASWPLAQTNTSQRVLLAVQAQKWAEQALQYSGLADAGYDEST